MTRAQKAIERNEFMCEDGAKEMYELVDWFDSREPGNRISDEARQALLDAAKRLSQAQRALASAYDEVGRSELDNRRRERC